MAESIISVPLFLYYDSLKTDSRAFFVKFWDVSFYILSSEFDFYEPLPELLSEDFY